MSQLALPLAWPAAPGDDAFLVSASNAEAVRLLEGWAEWPVRTAVLAGPRKSGRSLLARVFAGKSGGTIVEDADAVDETALFHAWNRAQETGRPLLLVTAQPPPQWRPALADLRSRLAASPVAEIGPPDDQLIAALLARGLERRGLDPRPDLVDWIADRIERSHLAVARVLDVLDQAAMERRRRLTIPFARESLAAAGLLAHEDL